MAVSLCNDILDDPQSDKAKLFCRVLSDLELDKANEQSLKDLKELMKSVYQVSTTSI